MNALKSVARTQRVNGVQHGELIPLHLLSFSAFISPLKQYQLLFCTF